jgi:hypothetical protein
LVQLANTSDRRSIMRDSLVTGEFLEIKTK